MNRLVSFFGIQMAAQSAFFLLAAASNTQAQAPDAKVWHFNQLNEIGGHKTEVLGHPRVIESPYGKAVEFGGNGDALVVPEHPLAGAKAFTWEVIFRPDADGARSSGSSTSPNRTRRRARTRKIACCLRYALSTASGAWTALSAIAAWIERC